MQVRIVPKDKKEVWNQFVTQSQFGDILQSWEWGEVKRSSVWEPIRVGVFEKGNLVGTAQVLKRQLPPGFTIIYCPRGPIINWQDPKATDTLTSLIHMVEKKYKDLTTLFFRIEPPLPQEQFSEQLKQQFQKLNLRPYFKSIQPRHTSIVDLTPSEEEILMNFEKDTRYSVRRAEREKVKVEMYNLQFTIHKLMEKIKSFYNLYLETAQRGKFTPRPWRQFEKIGELMMPQDLARLYLAYFEEELLAGALILKTEKRGYYLWGASERKYPKKFAPYLLQWEIIKDLKNSGVTSYDLCGIAPTDNPQHAWSGHTLFKKGFGGKLVDYIGCWDLPLSPLYSFYKTTDYLRQKFLQPDLIG